VRRILEEAPPQLIVGEGERIWRSMSGVELACPRHRARNKLQVKSNLLAESSTTITYHIALPHFILRRTDHCPCSRLRGLRAHGWHSQSQCFRVTKIVAGRRGRRGRLGHCPDGKVPCPCSGFVLKYYADSSNRSFWKESYSYSEPSHG
jgi:hypothetical protein